MTLSVFSETEGKRFKNWNPPKKERPAEPIPKPPPPSVRNLKRDRVYKILHPYEFYWHVFTYRPWEYGSTVLVWRASFYYTDCDWPSELFFFKYLFFFAFIPWEIEKEIELSILYFFDFVPLKEAEHSTIKTVNGLFTFLFYGVAYELIADTYLFLCVFTWHFFPSVVHWTLCVDVCAHPCHLFTLSIFMTFWEHRHTDTHAFKFLSHERNLSHYCFWVILCVGKFSDWWWYWLWKSTHSFEKVDPQVPEFNI